MYSVPVKLYRPILSKITKLFVDYGLVDIRTIMILSLG